MSIKREQYLSELSELMMTPSNRKVLWSILSKSNLFSITFAGDPATTAFNEGRRSVGLELWADLEAASFERLLSMQKEAMERANDDRNDAADPTADDDLKRRIGIGSTARDDAGNTSNSAGWFHGADPALGD